MQDDEFERIGFVYRPDALSATEQTALVDSIDGEGRWEPDYDRLAQRHGYRYKYKSDTLVRIGPLAPWIKAWAETVRERGRMYNEPDQITAQWYEPGTGIGDHCDSPLCFGPKIATISLLAPCTYRFFNPVSRELHTKILEPGCLVLLSGEARDRWKHVYTDNQSYANYVAATFRHVPDCQSRPCAPSGCLAANLVSSGLLERPTKIFLELRRHFPYPICLQNR